jgi:pimeloyl-ACP methyl ester carboxylesterase
LSFARRGNAVDPPALLLPGPTDSWRSYQPVLERLPPETHAIAVSQRGHGDSDRPQSGYRVEDFAVDVVLLLDALGIERAVLVGHSGSCLVARKVALDQPHRVAGLFLESSPTTMHDDPNLARSLDSLLSELEDPITPEFARSFLTRTSAAGLQPDLVDLLVADLLKVPTRVWRETFSGLIQYDDLSELRRIAAPTQLIWGDADAIVPREMQDRLARSIPDAALTVYRGVGHTPRWQEPTRFSADLAAFVSEKSPLRGA